MASRFQQRDDAEHHRPARLDHVEVGFVGALRLAQVTIFLGTVLTYAHYVGRLRSTELAAPSVRLQ